MATARPFARNTGLPIDGTATYGNICVGFTNEVRYDENYGGLQWWNGPDEELGYIIGTDVPTENWPTPVGNVGSVRFWRTSAFTDNDFINLSDRLTGQSFTGGSQARTYLLSNGYWTSYTASTATTYQGILISTSGASTPGWDLIWNPVNKEVYSNNFAADAGPAVISTSGSTPQELGLLPISGTSSSGDNAIDITNNKLFTGDVNGNVVTKYNLNTKTIELTAQPYVVSNNNFQFEYNPVYDKLLICNDDDLPGKVYVLSGANLTTITTISNPTATPGPYHTVTNTNNGNYIFLVQNTINTYDYFLCNGNTDTIIYSGNSNSGTHLFDNEHVYSPVSDKFFVQGKSQGVDQTKYVAILDGTTGEYITRIDLGYSSGQYNAMIYDSRRNYVWTPYGTASSWAVIDCDTNSIIHTFSETFLPSAQYGGYSGTYDYYNDRLIIGAGGSYKLKYFNCGDILPIT